MSVPFYLDLGRKITSFIKLMWEMPMIIKRLTVVYDNSGLRGPILNQFPAINNKPTPET